MIKLKIFSESIELQASTNTNQYPFMATITYGGKLSRGVVGGTEDLDGGPYRVLISADLLREKIKELIGKSVLVSDLESHKRNYKIGTFKQAWVEAATLPDGTLGLAARASGIIEETEENSEIVQQIIEEARAEKLGFSYDIKDVVVNLKASTDSSSEQYVEVVRFEWRGATVVRRAAAAYDETRLAASKPTPRKDQDDMTPEQIRDAIAPLISPLQTSIESIKTEQASQKAELQVLKAAGTPKDPPKEEGNQAKDIAAAVTAAIVEANKPVMEAMAKTLEAVTKKEDDTPPTGTRKTLRFTGSDFKSRYNFGSEDMKLNTVEGCDSLINEIHASSIPDEKKVKMLGAIGAQKRVLMRSAQAGGAN